MFRKEKEQHEKSQKINEDPQILTRSRVREHKKNKERNKWLNKAIIIVGILLAILIYAILKL